MKLSKKAKGVQPSATLEITAKAKRLKKEGKKIIAFTAGEPDFNTPDFIVNSAITALKEGFTKYTPSAGIPELRAAIAEKFRNENGIECDAENIVVSDGAKSSLYHAMLAVIDDGDEVIVPSPYWVTYTEQIKLCGGVPVLVPTKKEDGYKMTAAEGSIMSVIAVVLLVLLVAAPAFIHFTKAGGGPGAKHAAVAVSLIAAVAVGYLTQRTRFCMIAGIRDFILFRETKMLWGFVAVVAAAAACNVVLTSVTGGAFFKVGFAAQPIAHTDALWNVLGLFLAGFACVLLGGCPMRQLVLSGEGNSDSAVTLLGFIVGAAFAHNFGLASSGNGPTANGQIAVVIGIVVVTVIAYLNTYKK